ncbi:MAG: PilZ domain-containing protein [Sphingopyxis sp.]|uniref:PilZ domain-containing protein n=1 Tax=Sphingopyxis sp. TaxID=1908224 RepID=UPI003D80F60F
MTSSRPPLPRAHRRTPTDIDVIVNGVLNQVEGRLTDLSEGGARIDGVSMPERSRCEIHYGGQTVYAVVMWAEFDRMGVRFPYELTHGPLHQALERARNTAAIDSAQIFRRNRPSGFGRRGLY